MKTLHFLSALVALVALCQGQDMTSFVFQELGIEAPPLPPKMPVSLRQHLYSHERQQQQQRLLLQRQILQKQQQLMASKLRDMKSNPYSTSYTEAIKQEKSKAAVQNLLNSPANAIRRPGSNSIRNKANPYSVRNPYSTSRQETSRIPGVRKSVSQLPSNRDSAQLAQTMAAMKRMRSMNKRMKDAKSAGCKLPVDSTAASVLMFNTCRSQAAQLVCQSEMMQCNTVGMAAMCCPLGMNNLAMDTISYVNKLQKYVADLS